MRAKPRADAPITARKRFGDCGMNIANRCRGNWCPVEDGHYRGWIHRHCIAMVFPRRAA
jgi:SH3-like domain-containing protein